MPRVGTNESAGEDRRRKSLDVARLERVQKPDRDLRGGGNFLERDLADEPLPAEVLSERQDRCLAHSRLPGLRIFDARPRPARSARTLSAQALTSVELRGESRRPRRSSRLARVRRVRARGSGRFRLRRTALRTPGRAPHRGWAAIRPSVSGVAAVLNRRLNHVRLDGEPVLEDGGEDPRVRIEPQAAEGFPGPRFGPDPPSRRPPSREVGEGGPDRRPAGWPDGPGRRPRGAPGHARRESPRGPAPRPGGSVGAPRAPSRTAWNLRARTVARGSPRGSPAAGSARRRSLRHSPSVRISTIVARQALARDGRPAAATAASRPRPAASAAPHESRADDDAVRKGRGPGRRLGSRDAEADRDREPPGDPAGAADRFGQVARQARRGRRSCPGRETT